MACREYLAAPEAQKPFVTELMAGGSDAGRGNQAFLFSSCRVHPQCYRPSEGVRESKELPDSRTVLLK